MGRRVTQGRVPAPLPKKGPGGYSSADSEHRSRPRSDLMTQLGRIERDTEERQLRDQPLEPIHGAFSGVGSDDQGQEATPGESLPQPLLPASPGHRHSTCSLQSAYSAAGAM